MIIDLTGKKVLVTGSSRGIGKATARLFAESGAQVAVHYQKNKKAAEAVMADLPGEGHMLVRGDISDASRVRQIVNEIIDKFRRIDILVNNAGIYEEVDFVTLDYQGWQEKWKKTIDINLTGVSNLSFLVGRLMIINGGGKIINVSSRGAFRGEPTSFAYGASKAGLNALGQSMAKALAPYHVFVYTIAPGWVDTDMATEGLDSPRGDEIRNQSPLSRVATPEEIARAIIYFASESTDYMTGCILDINGASYLRS